MDRKNKTKKNQENVTTERHAGKSNPVELADTGGQVINPDDNAPGLMIENADTWLADSPYADRIWINVGRVIISKGVLRKYPYPSITQALAIHATGIHAETGDRFEAGDERRARIRTLLQSETLETISIETFLAEGITEIKLLPGYRPESRFLN